MRRQNGLSCWTPVLKVSFGESAAHSMAAYMPLQVSGVVPRGLIGVVGPSHQMDCLTIFTQGLSVRGQSDSSCCYLKGITGSTCVGGFLSFVLIE